MMQRSGQTTEFFQRLAFVVIAVGALTVALLSLNIGGIGNSLATQSAVVVQGGEQLAIIGYKCVGSSAGTTFTLSVQNNGANALELKPPWQVTGLSGASGIGACDGFSSTTVFSGEVAACKATLPSCGKVGKPYSIGIVMGYADTQTGLVYKPVRNVTAATQPY
ncbi:MAG: hypothetical protein HY366_02790 [Candidatus Aenigmarchaeota archaeon]|nr:hypothetical protein [Candidatus Aenigmarchaeota archaeon]